MATHNNSITVNIALDGAPGTVRGFGNALLLFESATIHGGTDRVRAYGSYEEAEDDADLPASALAAVNTAFSQPTPPQTFKVGRKVPTTETWTQAITAVRAADDDFYALAVSSRVNADVEEVSEALEPTKKLALLQSGEATLLTNSIAAALADCFIRERTALVYHPTNTQWADVAWAVNRLAFDPDTISVPWDCELGGVSAPAALTQGQYDFAIANNVNVLAPLGPAPVYLDRGVNAKGRPIYELLTRDWFEARLTERVAQLRVDLSRRGQKLVINNPQVGALNTTAQAQLTGIAAGLYQEGVAAGHFVPDVNAIFTALPLTAEDISLRRVRIVGKARLAVSGVLYTFNLSFTRLALSAA